MKTKRRLPVPQVAGIRSSVEIQHGRKGVARMFRRGLHGAKNWILEPEEDGAPRSVWGKLLRTAVILLPLWIALSATTDGSGRGGTSVPKAILTALLVAVVGLACLSARERRQGREEPWAELPSLGTESNEDEAVTLIGAPVEAPTLVTESPQVSKPPSGDESRSGGSIPGDSTQTTQSNASSSSRPLAGPSHQANPEGVIPLDSQGAPPVGTPFSEGVPQAIPEDVEAGHSDASATDVFLPSVPAPSPPSIISLHKATPEASYLQVRANEQEVPRPSPQATMDASKGQKEGVTDSKQDNVPEAPVHTEFQGAFRQDALPQLSPTGEPSGDPIQAAFQPDFAELGPYEVTEDPVSGDWWLTPPDAPQKEAAEEPAEEVQEQPALPPVEPQQAPVEEEAEDAPEMGGQPIYPPVVMRYFVSRVSDVTESEKEKARDEVMEWARQEFASQRRTQAEMARILGVGKATLSRWVNDDPWADPSD